MQNVELVISSYTFWSRLWILYKNISYSVGVRCCQQSSLYCPPSVSQEKIRELSDWVTGGTEYYFNHLQLVIQEVNEIKCGWTILEKISSRDFIRMWRQVTDLTTVFSTPKITIHGKGQCFQQLLIRRVAGPSLSQPIIILKTYWTVAVGLVSWVWFCCTEISERICSSCLILFSFSSELTRQRRLLMQNWFYTSDFWIVKYN